MSTVWREAAGNRWESAAVPEGRPLDGADLGISGVRVYRFGGHPNC
jgi:hypothetical protein